MIALAFGLSAAGMALVASDKSLTALFAGLVVCGMGFGLTTPTLTGWLQSRMPAQMRGRAAGGYTMAHFLGQFLATFVFASLAGVTTFSAQHPYATAGNFPISVTVATSFDTEFSHTVTLPANAAAWNAVLTVRIGLVARSAQPEKPAGGATACNTTTVAPTWSGSATAPFNLTANANWQCYRYKVFETVIPVKNILWTQG